MAPRKILIIRFSSIGDIILTTPVIRCIHLQLQAEIHVLTKSNFANILRPNPHVHRVHEWEHTSLAQLKEFGFEHVFDLQKNRTSGRVVRFLGLPYTSFHKLNFLKWVYVNTKLNFLPEKHLVDRYFDALAPLGINNDGLGCDAFYDKTRVSEKIQGMTVEKYNVLVLGAAHATKRISLRKAREILSWHEHPCFLLGGNDVVEMAAVLKKEFPNSINLVGKTNLDESIHLLEQANIVFSGDTGLMHIAAALGKKLVVLWGNTTPAFGMFPYYGIKNKVPHVSFENKILGCRPCSKLGFSTCPKGHFECMEKLVVDTKAIESLEGT